jgi:hypothetical protein
MTERTMIELCMSRVKGSNGFHCSTNIDELGFVGAESYCLRKALRLFNDTIENFALKSAGIYDNIITMFL